MKSKIWRHTKQVYLKFFKRFGYFHFNEMLINLNDKRYT